MANFLTDHKRTHYCGDLRPTHAGQDVVLQAGMVITIEPIIAAGKGEVQTGRDGWTVCTVDRSRSAHYEHTIVITRGRPIILTAA